MNEVTKSVIAMEDARRKRIEQLMRDSKKGKIKACILAILICSIPLIILLGVYLLK